MRLMGEVKIGMMWRDEPIDTDHRGISIVFFESAFLEFLNCASKGKK